MAYSLAFSQAISILLYITTKMQVHDYEFVATKTIAEALNFPVPTTVKILKNLNAAGLTTTKEGAGGGILLARPPAKITLLDVFLAIEQNKPLFKIPMKLNIEGERVEHARRKISESLQDAETSMKETLQGVILQDLLL